MTFYIESHLFVSCDTSLHKTLQKKLCKIKSPEMGSLHNCKIDVSS